MEVASVEDRLLMASGYTAYVGGGAVIRCSCGWRLDKIPPFPGVTHPHQWDRTWLLPNPWET